jgi:2-polyprenyl-3-methyl-5-hydroxy-6-metoxy-1,4-benzoquinol methylase
MRQVASCACCGSGRLSFHPVLWKSLVDEWRLSPHETRYIDRQQGLRCVECGSNLRTMALAVAIVRAVGQEGTLAECVRRDPMRRMRILEVNEAGDLTQFLARIPGHILVRYPDVDMTALPYPERSFDIVVHSDTLEHVDRPVTALGECRRVLVPGGFCAFTVPIVVDRLTASRDGKPPSYHGAPGQLAGDFAVHTEYGADAWKHVVQAGFNECRIYSLEYPAAAALVGVKWDEPEPPRRSGAAPEAGRTDAAPEPREGRTDMHDLEFTGERLVPGKVDANLWHEHMSRYMLAGESLRGKTVLDAGCGAGYGADYLAALGAKSVLAVDISPDAIAYARDHYRQDNLEYRVASLSAAGTISGKFDVIVSFEVIEHLPDPDLFLAEVSRLLADGGTFIVSTPDRVAYRQDDAPNPFHAREFDLAEFTQLLGRHFRRVQMFAQHHLGAIAITPTNAAGDMVIDHGLLRNAAYHRYFIAFCGHGGESVETAGVPRLIPFAGIDWQPLVRRAAGDLERVIPAGATVILVDQDECGPALAPGRSVRPFPEHDGQYWGPPADSESAVRELERLRDGGAAYIAFAWPAFWWLDFYAGLTTHLGAHYRRVLSNERLVIFDLRERTGGGG